MAWVRLDDQFARHPKMIAAKPDGMAMHVAAICYCNQYLTDGWVPDDVASSLLAVRRPGEIIARLCKVGAWTEHEGGYRLHDYLDFQPSRETVLADRKKARDRQEKARQSRRDSQGDKQRDNGVTHGGVTGAPTRTQEVLPDTPAAEVQKENTSSTFGSSYAGTNGNGHSAAAEESPPEHTVRDAAHQFGSDFNIIEPLARQLSRAAFDALVVRMAAKVARGAADEPWALFTDLLQREIKATRVAAVKVHIPTLEEQFAHEARGLAFTTSPADVIDELLAKSLNRQQIPEHDRPRLLEIAHAVIAEVRSLVPADGEAAAA